MPRPKAGTGQTSDLRAALSHPDQATVQAFIDRVAASYAETRDLTKTAVAFGCERRTLERAISRFPVLAQAIENARDRAAIVP